MWTSNGRTADKKSQLFIADFSMDARRRPSVALSARFLPSFPTQEARLVHAKDAIRRRWTSSDRIVALVPRRPRPTPTSRRGPSPGMNHIAWQLGHLISVERKMVEAIKPGSCPALPDGFDEAHGKDAGRRTTRRSSRPRTSTSGSSPAQREATKTVLDGLTDAELTPPPANTSADVPDRRAT